VEVEVPLSRKIVRSPCGRGEISPSGVALGVAFSLSSLPASLREFRRLFETFAIAFSLASFPTIVGLYGVRRKTNITFRDLDENYSFSYRNLHRQHQIV